MSPGNEVGSSGAQYLFFQNSNKRIRENGTSPKVNKNQYSLLSSLNDDNEDMNLVTSSKDEDQQPTEVSQKIPPIYVHNITDFENFHSLLSTSNSKDFSITQIKNALKSNFSSIDNYSLISKKY